MKNHASLTFFESSDPDLFANYVQLRRRVFNLRYTLPPNFGEPDTTDRLSCWRGQPTG